MIKHTLPSVFMKEDKLNYILRIRKGWSDWAINGDWNIYGTLNFALHRKPSFAEAQRKWSFFWNLVDRLSYGKGFSVQHRVPRFVYAHKGRNGDNPHIHFLIKVDGDVREFCILLNALWASLEHLGAAIADQNEILPVISKERVSEYLKHEDHGYEMNGFCEYLTHLPENAQPMRYNALALLRSAANLSEHLNDAEIAFDKHLELAEQRYIRRNSN